MTSHRANFFKSMVLGVGSCMIAALMACSSSSTNTTPPKTVAIVVTSGSGQTATVGKAFSAPLVATVTTGGTPSSGVTVTFTAPSSGASGSFAGGGATATATTNSNGVATSPAFTANSTAGSYAVTATAPGATSPANFQLTNAMAPTVTIAATSGSNQTATIGKAFAAPLVATVTTGGTPTSGVTVTFTAPSSGASASFAGGGATATATTNSSGVATSPMLTANSTSGAYTVTASVAGAATPANFSLTNAAMVAGNYVFSMEGTNTIGSPYYYVGTITVGSSGAITDGEQDFADGFYFVRAEPITSGTISTTSDGNLLITLQFTDTYINKGKGTVTFDANSVSTSRALLTEYDSWGSASGQLELQATSLPAPSGGFAFAAPGWEISNPPFFMGGVINVDGAGTISGAGSVLDFNANGTLYPDQALTANSGTVTGPDTYGLVTFSLNFTCPSFCPTKPKGSASIVMDGYMVDANHIRIIENWYADDISALVGGTALNQGANTGTFNTASVSGLTYVISSSGYDPHGGFRVAAALTFDSDGSVGGNLSFNDTVTGTPQGGTALAAESTTTPCSSGSATTACYKVDPTGRVTLTNVTDGATFNYELQLYLSGDGQAELISLDALNMLGGSSWQQASGLSAASLSGNYSINYRQVISGNAQDAVGAFNANGSNSVSGFTDINQIFTVGVGTLTPNVAFADSYAATSTNGVLNVTSSGKTATPYTGYLVDGTQGVFMENFDSTTQLTLGYFAQK